MEDKSDIRADINRELKKLDDLKTFTDANEFISKSLSQIIEETSRFADAQLLRKYSVEIPANIDVYLADLYSSKYEPNKVWQIFQSAKWTFRLIGECASRSKIQEMEYNIQKFKKIIEGKYEF